LEHLFQVLVQRNFTPTNLLVGAPDNSAIRVVLLQHSGAVVAGPAAIGNADQDAAHRQHLAFLELVSGMQPAPALVATPEYSTPWSVIEAALAQGLQPAEGVIWLLGCESATPAYLKDLIAKHPGVFWHSEIDTLVAGNKVFVDPLVMMFRGVSSDGSARTLALALQFKTTPMGGGEGQIERDHMIPGTKQYILRSIAGNQIALATILCSDALAFKHFDLLEHLYWPYLVIHLQCTKNVYRDILRSYRQNIYTRNEGLRYSCLTLNWAKGTTVDGAPADPWTFGGSAIYFRPDKRKYDSEPRQTDAVIDRSHKAGIYLHFCKEHESAAYFFANPALIFDFYTTKHDQTDAVGAQDRAGISDPTTYAWDGTTWVPAQVDDGVSSVFAAAGIQSLVALQDRPAARERLLAFSIGAIPLTLPWHQPAGFTSYQATSGSEVPRGSCALLRSDQVQEVDHAASRFHVLESEIIVNRLTQPVEFSDLEGKVPSLAMYQDERGVYASNLCAEGQPVHAAVIFLGDKSAPLSHAFFDEFVSKIKPNRAAIWFRESNELKCIATPARKISDDQHDRRSILKEDE
jgi:hypothetical protein